MRNSTKSLLGIDIYNEGTIYVVTTVDLPLTAIMMFVARQILSSYVSSDVEVLERGVRAILTTRW